MTLVYIIILLPVATTGAPVALEHCTVLKGIVMIHETTHVLDAT